MNDASNIIVTAVAFSVLPLIVGYIVGYRAGVKHGHAEGWLEHYSACVARDRARRQRNGQFKAKEAKAL